MRALPKRLASHLSLRVQQELKRQHFALQLARGIFKSDEPEFARLDEWVMPGDWVLDIGANVGHYAARLSQLVGPTGRVFAFEPMPESFELLSANMIRNRYRNTTLFNVAVSEESQLVGMEVRQFDTGLDNFYEATIGEGGDTQVLTVSIDALHLPKPIALAKIDVESHELPVLMGMKETIRRDRPLLIVEGRDPGVEQFLTELGYGYERAEHSPNRVFRPED